MIIPIFLIYSPDLCWGLLTACSVTTKFVQLHYFCHKILRRTKILCSIISLDKGGDVTPWNSVSACCSRSEVSLQLKRQRKRWHNFLVNKSRDVKSNSILVWSSDDLFLEFPFCCFQCKISSFDTFYTTSCQKLSWFLLQRHAGERPNMSEALSSRKLSFRQC